MKDKQRETYNEAKKEKLVAATDSISPVFFYPKKRENKREKKGEKGREKEGKLIIRQKREKLAAATDNNFAVFSTKKINYLVLDKNCI